MGRGGATEPPMSMAHSLARFAPTLPSQMAGLADECLPKYFYTNIFVIFGGYGLILLKVV